MTKRYTCIECQKEMDEKNSKFNTITYKNKLAEINTSNEYVRGVSYKSTGSCIWHNRRQIETCIICNKPLCDICAYYEIKSFFGFNKKIIGPFCFGHMPKEKNWTIFLEKEGREFTVSK
ncbi:MAG: hypothetical protein K8T10_08850 [Candidatus Eremiobacteraeota bacterium]|nr:hypothetical protein [Candidatus Eremiobacteraeota bacterium]